MKSAIEWPIESQLTESYLQFALRSRKWWSQEGEFVRRFEKGFAKFVGTSFALCCSSGSTALEISLRSLDVGYGDLVVIPSLTFIGTATAVLRVGAIPIFADAISETGCISPESIINLTRQHGKRIKAVIVVHLGGQCCEMDAIMRWSTQSGIPVIEDCAQAVGSVYRNHHVGTFGVIGCFSFQNSKNLTSGEGGCIVTNDQTLAVRIGKYIDYNHDIFGESKEFIYLAGNHRLSEFQGAVLLSQLEDFDRQNKIRELRYGQLRDLLRDIGGLEPLPMTEGTTRHGCHLFMARYKAEHFGLRPRAHFIEHLRRNNVPAWEGYDNLPLNRFPYFRDRIFLKFDPLWNKLPIPFDIPSAQDDECPNADRLVKEFVWISQFALLREENEMERIGQVVRDFKTATVDAA